MKLSAERALICSDSLPTETEPSGGWRKSYMKIIQMEHIFDNTYKGGLMDCPITDKSSPLEGEMRAEGV